MKVPVITMHNDEEYLYQAISAGADGYLLKEDAEKELLSAIKSIQNDRAYISPSLADRSMQNWVRIRHRGGQFLRFPTADAPLKLIAEAKSNKVIGDLLCISVRTVERHRANRMNKLNIRKRLNLCGTPFANITFDPKFL